MQLSAGFLREAATIEAVLLMFTTVGTSSIAAATKKIMTIIDFDRWPAFMPTVFLGVLRGGTIEPKGCGAPQCPVPIDKQ